MLLLKRAHDAQNLIVGLALGQSFRQGIAAQLRLKEQPSAGVLVAELAQRYATINRVFRDIGDQCVQRARDLPRIAGHLGHTLLVIVQFLQSDHGQVDIMLGKAKQGCWVVHQYIRIQHK